MTSWWYRLSTGQQHQGVPSASDIVRVTSEERDNNRMGWSHCGIQMIVVTHIPLIKCSCLNKKKGLKWFQSYVASWEMEFCDISSQTDVCCRGQDGRNTIQIMNQQRNNSRLCYFSWASLYTFDSAVVEALICWQRRTSTNLVKVKLHAQGRNAFAVVVVWLLTSNVNNCSPEFSSCAFYRHSEPSQTLLFYAVQLVSLLSP